MDILVMQIALKVSNILFLYASSCGLVVCSADHIFRDTALGYILYILVQRTTHKNG